MNKQHTLLVSIRIVLLLVLLFATVSMSEEDNPKAPPNWGWTKIADVTIKKYYVLQGETISKNIKIHLFIDVKKNFEERTEVTELYSGTQNIGKVSKITTMTNRKIYVTKRYSDPTTQFSLTSSVVANYTLNTTLSVTLFSSEKNGRTYYGTYSPNVITYTYTYAGNDTWVGFYTTTVTFSNETIIATYRASIIQS